VYGLSTWGIESIAQTAHFRKRDAENPVRSAATMEGMSLLSIERNEDIRLSKEGTLDAGNTMWIRAHHDGGCRGFKTFATVPS